MPDETPNTAAPPSGWHDLEDGGAALTVTSVRRSNDSMTFRVAPPIPGAPGPKGQWQLYVTDRGAERYDSKYPTRDAAITEANDIVQGIRDEAALDRKTTLFGELGGTWTLWGKAHASTQIARGITSYTAGGHGGMKLSPAMNEAMPDHLRLENRHYEEDGDWARVATAFPEHFTAREKQRAERILRNGMPDAWEIQYGQILQPGMSLKRDQQRFLEAHKGELIVVSASMSKEHPDQLVVSATIDGNRNAEWHRFLVPAAEYSERNKGIGYFAVDPARHPRLEQEHALAR